MPFLNGGEHFTWAPEVPIWFSLLVIIGTLVITTVLSLLKVRRDPEAAVHMPNLAAGPDPSASELAADAPHPKSRNIEPSDTEASDTDSRDIEPRDTEPRRAETPAPVPDDHRER